MKPHKDFSPTFLLRLFETTPPCAVLNNLHWFYFGYWFYWISIMHMLWIMLLMSFFKFKSGSRWGTHSSRICFLYYLPHRQRQIQTWWWLLYWRCLLGMTRKTSASQDEIKKIGRDLTANRKWGQRESMLTSFQLLTVQKKQSVGAHSTGTTCQLLFEVQGM